MKTIKIMVLCVIVSLIMLSSKAKAEAPDIPPTAQDYIVEFAEKYNTDPNVLLKVAKCESRYEQIKGDGGHATGIFQYWNNTWNDFEKLIGEELDINSIHDQAKMTAFIFAKYPKYKTRWTSYVAIQKGGVYSFYSSKLHKHFTVNCK